MTSNTETASMTTKVALRDSEVARTGAYLYEGEKPYRLRTRIETAVMTTEVT
jgi:hypothetical protein